MKMATRATSARSTSDAAVHTNAELRRVALAGLRGTPKTLPCSLFYDDAGAALFEQICDTPEYYPTRTEIGILRDNLAEITAAIGMNARLVELGSGEAVKTRILLRQLDAIEYVPVDISRTQLQETAQCMARDFPRVRVRPICGDYTQRLLLPAAVAGVARTAIFFPGSTIGNFEPADAEAFLRSLANLIAWQGGLLIGVDLHKDPNRLNAAYNDAQGITAEFNLNVLRVLNRQARANFDAAQFTYSASYDELHRRIQMRLISTRNQQVMFASGNGLGEAVIDFKAGESIITEHSYKYSLADFGALVERAGWLLARTWVDAEQLFAVHWCVPR